MPIRKRFAIGVALYLVCALLAGGISCSAMHIDSQEIPSDVLGAWALAELAGDGGAGTEAPEVWQGPGPNVIIRWSAGLVDARFVGGGDLVQDVHDAKASFAEEPPRAGDTVRYTVEVGLGDGPVIMGVPYLRELSLVPLHEGLRVTLGDETRVLTPEQMRADGTYDAGIPTPIPELSLGVPLLSLVGRLARDMGVTRNVLVSDGTVERFRSYTIAESEYPRSVEVNETSLRTASVEAAEFLIRHQRPDGEYTYVYDGRSGTAQQGGYNIPRHAGSTYFLAQVDRLHGHPESRQGALRALHWLERGRIQACGDELCVVEGGRADVGSAALTVVAAAEILLKEEDPLARRLVEGLSAFLRSQQRDDGELMHEYDREAGRPVDVQFMYYSGEAAFAFMRAYEATGDERNLESVRRLMTHLTGASWDFLGSRYYYGEEHWTCIAAGAGRGNIDMTEALDFCQRWFEWNDVLQFREGETPWPVEGAYGVGPVVIPRLTPVGSRTEAFIGTYLIMRDAGLDTTDIRALVERGLGQLLRYRWAPGPTHLLADPEAAQGAVPGSPTDLLSRNDFTQHAGSAWIRWADILREEREAEGSSGSN